MSNEEVAEILKLYKQRLNESCSNLLDRDKEALDLAIKALEDRPQGKWELCKDTDGEYGICSNCSKDTDFSYYGKAYNYCPNCGAKMKEAENET